MKISDRFWLLRNKKKPSIWTYYFSIFFSGFITGLIIATSFLLFVTGYNTAGWIVLVVIAGLIIINCVFDNKNGYVEALHKRQVELWEERRKKIEGR